MFNYIFNQLFSVFSTVLNSNKDNRIASTVIEPTNEAVANTHDRDIVAPSQLAHNIETQEKVEKNTKIDLTDCELDYLPIELVHEIFSNLDDSDLRMHANSNIPENIAYKQSAIFNIFRRNSITCRNFQIEWLIQNFDKPKILQSHGINLRYLLNQKDLPASIKALVYGAYLAEPELCAKMINLHPHIVVKDDLEYISGHIREDELSCSGGTLAENQKRFAVALKKGYWDLRLSQIKTDKQIIIMDMLYQKLSILSVDPGVYPKVALILFKLLKQKNLNTENFIENIKASLFNTNAYVNPKMQALIDITNTVDDLNITDIIPLNDDLVSAINRYYLHQGRYRNNPAIGEYLLAHSEINPNSSYLHQLFKDSAITRDFKQQKSIKIYKALQPLPTVEQLMLDKLSAILLQNYRNFGLITELISIAELLKKENTIDAINKIFALADYYDGDVRTIANVAISTYAQHLDSEEQTKLFNLLKQAILNRIPNDHRNWMSTLEKIVSVHKDKPSIKSDLADLLLQVTAPKIFINNDTDLDNKMDTLLQRIIDCFKHTNQWITQKGELSLSVISHVLDKTQINTVFQNFITQFNEGVETRWKQDNALRSLICIAKHLNQEQRSIAIENIINLLNPFSHFNNIYNYRIYRFVVFESIKALAPSLSSNQATHAITSIIPYLSIYDYQTSQYINDIIKILAVKLNHNQALQAINKLIEVKNTGENQSLQIGHIMCAFTKLASHISSNEIIEYFKILQEVNSECGHFKKQQIKAICTLLPLINNKSAALNLIAQYINQEGHQAIMGEELAKCLEQIPYASLKTLTAQDPCGIVSTVNILLKAVENTKGKKRTRDNFEINGSEQPSKRQRLFITHDQKPQTGKRAAEPCLSNDALPKKSRRLDTL